MPFALVARLGFSALLGIVGSGPVTSHAFDNLIICLAAAILLYVICGGFTIISVAIRCRCSCTLCIAQQRRSFLLQ